MKYYRNRIQNKANFRPTGIDWRGVGALAAVLGLVAAASKATNTRPNAADLGGSIPRPVNNRNTNALSRDGNLLPSNPASSWIEKGTLALYLGSAILKALATDRVPVSGATQSPSPPSPLIQGGYDDVSSIDEVQTLPKAAEPATNSQYKPPIDRQWLRLATHPAVILVLGRRGSGKSALGYRLLELFRSRGVPYVVGVPAAARKLLPEWIGYADRLEDVPPKAVILLDEAYMQYHARGSMGTGGRSIGQMVNLSRQKEQTLIFIVQEARQLDVNVISQADIIAVKELSEISWEFERPQLRRFTDKARVAFSGIKGNKQRWTWVYSETFGEAGLVENELASFWKPALSRAFAKIGREDNSESNAQRKGQKAPREDLKQRAMELKLGGYSYGEIAVTLGISKAFAWKLVNETGEV